MRSSLRAVVLALAVFAPVAAPASDETCGATLTPDMPPGAIVVPASDGALAAAISSHETNTTFFLKTGVHTGNGEMRPKSGSVFVGESGAILDGGKSTGKCFVHDGSVIPYSASAPRYVVTLRNLVIRNYAPADQECAVMAQDTGLGWDKVLSDPADRNGWLLQHCTFEANRAGGAFLGSASTASRCLASHNGQVGFKATGRKVKLRKCRSTGNNVERKFDYFVEAGGVKCWNVKDLLIVGGEYDGNGGAGVWLDYVWDGNVIRGSNFHDNFRSGIGIEMAVGVEVSGCTLSHDDIDGIAGTIPVAFRPWDDSPKSGPDLWDGEISLFNGAGAGTYVDAGTKVTYAFKGKTLVHANRISGGNGGVMCLYQDRGSINPFRQMEGDRNGPVAGLDGIVVRNNEIACVAGYNGGVNTLANRDYQDAAGSWGPIPAKQAETQARAVRYLRNRYSANLKFSVPKATTMSEKASVWDWNDRTNIDLAKWQELGYDLPAPGQ